MLLKVFKQNQAFHFLSIPLLAIALWGRSFVQSTVFPFYSGEDSMILYQPISYLLGTNQLANNLVALGFIILLAFLILKLNYQYSFIRVRTFLPSILFVLITSGVPEMHAMHPVYPAALFLIIAVDRIFAAYEKEKIHSNAFDAGIFLAIGSLFYLNMVFFFPVLWFGLIVIKQKVNWREYILTTLGFLLPWVSAFVYYAATEQTTELFQVLESNILTNQIFLREGLQIQIYMGYLVILTILGSFFLLAQYDEKKISSRRFFKVFFWIFLISTILILASPAVSHEIIILLAIPLTFLISNYLIFMKRQFWGEVFLYLLTAGIILLQFI